jgi:hypothetical protein
MRIEFTFCTCQLLFFNISLARTSNANLVAQQEEIAAHSKRLRLREIKARHNALANVRDVQVGSLRAESRCFPVRIRVKVAEQRRGVVDFPVGRAIEPGWVAPADALRRQWPVVHDYIRALYAGCDAAEEV